MRYSGAIRAESVTWSDLGWGLVICQGVVILGCLPNRESGSDRVSLPATPATYKYPLPLLPFLFFPSYNSLLTTLLTPLLTLLLTRLVTAPLTLLSILGLTLLLTCLFTSVLLFLLTPPFTAPSTIGSRQPDSPAFRHQNSLPDYWPRILLLGYRLKSPPTFPPVV